MADRRKPPGPPHVMADGRTLAPAVLDWIAAIASDVATEAEINIGSALSGYAQKSELSTERVERIAGDSAISGSGDGTGTSNSGVYNGIAVTSSSWVTAKALLLTPTGPPGDYTFSILADLSLDTVATISDNGTFYGLWRLVEKRVSDSAETVIDSGTFEAEYSPSSTETFEGGGVVVPATVSATFTGLPGVVAATYSTTQTELRLDLSRASGSNTISAMSGVIAVVWSA